MRRCERVLGLVIPNAGIQILFGPVSAGLTSSSFSWARLTNLFRTMPGILRCRIPHSFVHIQIFLSLSLALSLSRFPFLFPLSLSTSGTESVTSSTDVCASGQKGQES